jgi:hypothetical protein
VNNHTKSTPIVAMYVSEKVSVVARRVNIVFPVAESPSKTIFANTKAPDDSRVLRE